jgi:hypothetical protein
MSAAPLLVLALLRSGCVCYHTASTTRSEWSRSSNRFEEYPN